MSILRTLDAAFNATAALGSYAEKLGRAVTEFAQSRSHNVPPHVYRFSHPVRRALPGKQPVKQVEVYQPTCSKSKVWEIHIHPCQTDPREIVRLAIAGLASCIAGPDVKHGDDYGKVASDLGLTRGKLANGRESWRTPVVDPESQVALYAVADALGPFPIGALDASADGRKVPDRNFSPSICPTCGKVAVRLSKKTLETRRVFCGGPRKTPHEPEQFTLTPQAEPAEVAA
jgi:hypothetical protein